MFQLDNNFLEELGLGAMPEEQKTPFLQHLYNELEMRVGTKLSDGLSDKQLAEFEALIDRKENAVAEWLSQNVSNYASEQAYLDLQKTTGLGLESPELQAEYAATKWLEANSPNYREVVAGVLNDLKNEIVANRDKLLS